MGRVRRIIVNSLTALVVIVFISLGAAANSHHSSTKNGAIASTSSQPSSSSSSTETVTATKPDKAAKALPSDLRKRLDQFLVTYYSWKKGDTSTLYAARVKQLVPTAVVSELDLSAPDTNVLSTSAMVLSGQLVAVPQHGNKTDLYITVPVQQTVNYTDNTSESVSSKTASEWKLVKSSWQLIRWIDISDDGTR